MGIMLNLLVKSKFLVSLCVEGGLQ